MYNEDRKLDFLEQVNNATFMNVGLAIFKRSEVYEKKYKKDLCAFSQEEIKCFLDEIIVGKTNAQIRGISVLNGYSNWCSKFKFNGYQKWDLKVEDIGVGKFKQQLVSDPLHLRWYLNQVFDPIEENTFDLVYRGYFWLAYFGIWDESQALQVIASNVDIEGRKIYIGSSVFDMYDESVLVFQKLIDLDSFNVHGQKKRRERAQGNLILRRGFYDEVSLQSFRSIITQKKSKFKKSYGDRDWFINLTYERAWYSGVYYRMYQAELEGVPPDFLGIVENFTKIQGRSNIKKTSLEYLRDYTRWKQAFDL